VIWLAGLKVLVFYWDVTTDTPNSSASPDLSGIQMASDPVMNTVKTNITCLHCMHKSCLLQERNLNTKKSAMFKCKYQNDALQDHTS
jgi:hypothetical protein